MIATTRATFVNKTWGFNHVVAEALTVLNFLIGTLMSYIVKFPPHGHLEGDKCCKEQKRRMVPACYFIERLACSVTERNRLM